MARLDQGPALVMGWLWVGHMSPLTLGSAEPYLEGQGQNRGTQLAGPQAPKGHCLSHPHTSHQPQLCQEWGLHPAASPTAPRGQR